ncbi:Na+/H+ antiporter subunit A [Thermobifida halotolerans]|uniref:Na+/H+ antiporter subunit A n=2 Tax=Thermobifida halotolerans TaxID=483545 RepID=A0A399G1H3_9ACTN|nr:Na+/H+ antiporter subunit A [Thermobifida halotolerans]UOE22197.1 Na+/H+ antiporter subunit A [Thermobifida halotolerans]
MLVAHFAAAVLAPVLVRWWGRNAFPALALVPAATAVWALVRAPGVVGGESVRVHIPWAPEFELTLAFRMDALGLVMTLLAAGIGALVLVYCSRYFDNDEPGLGRFAGVLTGFAGAMVGLVLADDLIQLYLYWELTTVLSYLLIGHHTERRDSRRAAAMAINVTTLGGLAMLVGLVMLGETAGTYLISELLADPPSGTPVPVALVLVLVGALSKSAVLPFSLWLPAAMQAPTPVSAYLHAAAMVKAGVYLVARLTPAFGDVAVWRYTALVLGTVTMVAAGWKALRQHDLKLLLAYGTVSQLGFLTAVFGAGTRDAALAGLAMLCAHALFKAPLFLVVGIIDHSTGTRDLRELSGLRTRTPTVFWTSVVALASMAGLPPTAGFAAKEAVFGAFEHADGPAPALALAGLVVGSAFTVGYSLRFLWGAFLDKPNVPPTPLHAPGPLFVAPAAALAALGLAGGLAAALADPVLAAYADTVGDNAGHDPAHLALWHGFSPPLLLSALCVVGGLALFRWRAPVAWAGARFALPDSGRVYRRIVYHLSSFATQVTGATQRGSLPLYLGTILVSLLVVSAVPIVWGRLWTLEAPPVRWLDTPAQLIPAAIVVLAALWTLMVRGRLFAVVLVGMTGYGTATLFALHGAPDLALTQFLVETVSLVVFVLVLRRLPPRFSTPVLRSRRLLNLGIGAATGTLVAAMAYFALAGRRAESVSGHLPAAAEEAGGHNIVSVLLVDVRAWDTMGEISVLASVAAGVASLLFVRRRARRVRTRVETGRIAARLPVLPAPPTSEWRPIPLRYAGDVLTVRTADKPLWLPGVLALARERRSVIFEVVARLLFPVTIVLSVYLLVTGHSAVGGGFAGGIVAGLGLMVRYLAGGRHELYLALRLPPGLLIGLGLAITTGTALAGAVLGTEILAGGAFDLHLPLLEPVHLTSGLAFDFGVYLLVVGLIQDILYSLGAGIDEQAEKASRTGRTPEHESEEVAA